MRELGRSDSARNQVDLVLEAVVDDGVVIARGDDELGTGLDSALALLEVNHGAGTDEDIGALLGHLMDAIGSGSGAEGHLGGRKATLDQSVGHGNSVLDLLQHDDRHDGRLLQLLVKAVLFHVLGRHIDFLSLHVELVDKRKHRRRKAQALRNAGTPHFLVMEDGKVIEAQTFCSRLGAIAYVLKHLIEALAKLGDRRGSLNGT